MTDSGEHVVATLRELGSAGQTGCLRVVGDRGTGKVFLRDGLVYQAFVPGLRLRIGQRLTATGAVTPEALAEALEAQKAELPDWLIGEILVHLGTASRAAVEAFVSELLIDQVGDLLTWQPRDVTFLRRRTTRSDVAPPCPVDQLLELVAARHARLDELLGAVGGAQAVLVPGPVLEASAPPSPLAAYVLAGLDGSRTLDEAAVTLALTRLEAAEGAAELLAAGQVRAAAAGPAANEPEPEPELDVEPPAPTDPAPTDPAPTDPAFTAAVLREFAGLHDVDDSPERTTAPRPATASGPSTSYGAVLATRAAREAVAEQQELRSQRKERAGRAGLFRRR